MKPCSLHLSCAYGASATWMVSDPVYWPFRYAGSSATYDRVSASASTPGAGGTFARLEVIQLAERHKAAAGAPGIDHDDLFGRPIARDVRLAAGTPRLPRRVGCRHRAPHFPDATFRRLHVL